MNMLKTIALLLLSGISYLNSLAQDYVPIIPQPNEVNLGNGKLKLRGSEMIYSDDPVFDNAIHVLQKQLLSTKQLTWFRTQNKEEARLRFEHIARMDTDTYTLRVSANEILIMASGAEAAQYAISSLIQLLLKAKQVDGYISLPILELKDKPAYKWRGFMLDESRQFYGKKKVKELLDWMAIYKLNTFHWHLTDEPAWRIEIKKYPFLTLIGGIGAYINPLAPAAYYTQEEIAEIVSYAAERQITIIPEIDMPGHATAANRAYPQFSGGGSKKHPHFTFHPAKEGTYTYLSNILKEVSVLFPSQMVHLGGDEVSYGSESWNTDKLVDSLKKAMGFKTNKEVETYFMRRMADSLYNMNAKLVVWDEMADANLPQEKTIQYWWRQDKPEQLELCLNNGYPTVLCPRLPFYFDFVQHEEHKYGRKWNKLYNPIENVYRFDISSLKNLQQYEGQILGVNANLWTETVHTEDRLDFLVFPRIAALAELAWTNDNRKNYDNFLHQLKNHLKWYKEAGIYYFDPFNNSNPEPVLQKPVLHYMDNPE